MSIKSDLHVLICCLFSIVRASICPFSAFVVTVMNPFATRSKWSMTLGPFTLHAREIFTSSKLPSKRELVERMIWFMVPRPKGSFIKTTKDWAAMKVAEELCEHWVFCNVYPKHIKNVQKDILSLYADFKKLQSCPKVRMTEKWVKETAEPYMTSLEVGLDIRTMDITFRKKQEEIYGVKETAAEEEFWQDQMTGKRIGLCENFVDRRWLAMDIRRKKDLESFQKRLEKSETEMNELSERVEVPEGYDDNRNVEKSDEEDFQVEEGEAGDDSSRKRRRVEECGSLNNQRDLPEGWKHIRKSVRQIRPEYITAVDRFVRIFQSLLEPHRTKYLPLQVYFRAAHVETPGCWFNNHHL